MGGATAGLLRILAAVVVVIDVVDDGADLAGIVLRLLSLVVVVVVLLLLLFVKFALLENWCDTFPVLGSAGSDDDTGRYDCSP